MTQAQYDTAQLIERLRPLQDEIATIQANYSQIVADMDKSRTTQRIDADNIRLDFETIQKQADTLAEDLTDLRDDLDDLGSLPAVQVINESLTLSLPEWQAHIARLKANFDALKSFVRSDEAIAKYLDNGGRRGIFSRKPDLSDEMIAQFIAFDQSLVDAIAGLKSFEASQLSALVEQSKNQVDQDYQTQVIQAEGATQAQIADVRVRAQTLIDELGAVSRTWRYSLWESFIKKSPRSDDFPSVIRVGNYVDDSISIVGDVPMLMPFTPDKHIVILAETDQFGQAQALLQSIVMRLIITLPADSAQFTFVDMAGDVLPFAKRAPKDLGGDTVFSDTDGINEALQGALHHIRQNSQEYVGSRFASLMAYNAQAKIHIPYQFICVSDLPSGFNPQALERLETIIERGAKAGVLLLTVVDKATQAFNLNALMREAVVINATPTTFSVNSMDFVPDSLTDKALMGALLSALRG